MTDATKQPYPTPAPNPNFVELEQEVLDYWKAENVFEQSVDNRSGEKPFVFYDGPPFANGLPHYGHLLTGYVKDMVARYQTMAGRQTPRRFGWDCHGLPAEMAAEKELKISGRQQITDYGIGKFNAHCQTSVMKYAGEWERYVDRQARWVDFENDYKTMDKDYMESVIWAFGELHKKGLVYESYRVMPYSWAAETPLSNFETKLDNSYREKEDKAVTVAFELEDIAWLRELGTPIPDSVEKVCILAWTTTPWTLPSNLALAVSEDMTYKGFASENDEKVWYIQSSEAWKKNGKGVITASFEGEQADDAETFIEPCIGFRGAKLIGKKFKPLFPYFAEHEVAEKAFRVLDGSSFIEEGSGTGVVHMAPGFGEDDMRVCAENGLGVVVPVDGQGKYTDELFDLEGDAPLKLKGLNVISETEGQCEEEPYKPEQLAKYGLANLRIIQWLKKKNALIKEEQYNHNYPHCWRTDTPIIYKAMSSWYIEVTKFRDRAVELNQEINWIPAHVKDGAMGHMLATAPDWSISRNRFWGCPIPIWRSDNPENDELYVFGSVAELEEFFEVEVPDLHRPFIDELTKPDPTNPKYTLTRVSDVFDCWFESGSMPFAQLHYPFENKDVFEQNFPADFITEYVGQTRGWFNTLIMLSTALFDKPPFKNCICHGVVLDEETGLKYSKRLKNYKDPMEVFDQFGSDALRWMMLSSPVMRGADIGVDPEGHFIRDVVRLHIKPLWNAYNFFCMYANADGLKAEFSLDSENIMDRYILTKTEDMTSAVKRAMDAYDAPSACNAISNFLDVLNNWYIRRSRLRFWSEEKNADKQSAYNTLYTVLHSLTRAAAPLMPMVAEQVYRGLTGAESSVHVQDFPMELDGFTAKNGYESLMVEMDRVQDMCNASHGIRNAENIRIRQPLSSLTVYGAGISDANADYFAGLIADETNVKKVHFSDDLAAVAERTLKVNFKVAGKRLGPKMKMVAGAAGKGEWEAKDGVIHVAGEVLEEGEYDMALKAREKKAGSAPTASQDALVVIDTAITPELASEGVARDVVRMVQQARKDAGLNVADRIELVIGAAGGVGDAVNTHANYISEQVLASSINVGNPAGEVLYSTEQSLEGEAIIVNIKKAAA